MSNLPFPAFLLPPSVLDFPIHTFEDKLLCCQDLSCLSTAEAMELTCQCKWKKGSVAGGRANGSYDKILNSFMECGFYEAVFSRQTDF